MCLFSYMLITLVPNPVVNLIGCWDLIEPYLIQQGFLVRTARGRMASNKAYRHLGLKPRPQPQAAADSRELFGE